MIEHLLVFVVGLWLGPAMPPPRTPAIGGGDVLNRMAFAVEGAESSHGRNPAMWRPDPHGPQGPMQVTRAAAFDVGGGNRFDLEENRQVGRAYLGLMYQRYGNWLDALAAYNWGPGNLDRWIAAGRPAAGLSAPIQAYVERIMRDVAAARPADTVVRPTVSTRAVAVVPDPPKPDIKDPGLRKKYERNELAIAQLREFIGGDGAVDAAVIATMHAVAVRPGYAQFANFRSGRPNTGSALREAAKVLLGKLQAESAALALIDARRQTRPR